MWLIFFKGVLCFKYMNYQLQFVIPLSGVLPYIQQMAMLCITENFSTECVLCLGKERQSWRWLFFLHSLFWRVCCISINVLNIDTSHSFCTCCMPLIYITTFFSACALCWRPTHLVEFFLYSHIPDKSNLLLAVSNAKFNLETQTFGS